MPSLFEPGFDARGNQWKPAKVHSQVRPFTDPDDDLEAVHSRVAELTTISLNLDELEEREPYDASAILANVEGVKFLLKDIKFNHPEKWKRIPMEDLPVSDQTATMFRALHYAYGITTMEAGARVPICDLNGNRLFTLVMATPGRKTGQLYCLVLHPNGSEFARFYKRAGSMTGSTETFYDSTEPCKIFGDMDISIGDHRGDPKLYATVRATTSMIHEYRRVDGSEGLDVSNSWLPGFLQRSVITVKRQAADHAFPKVPKIRSNGEMVCSFGRYADAQERLDYFLLLVNKVVLMKVREPPLGPFAWIPKLH